ncbi:hypothetical protein Hanom_Chr14g01293511 [Helianthus anomalus]
MGVPPSSSLSFISLSPHSLSLKNVTEPTNFRSHATKFIKIHHNFNYSTSK